MNQLRISEISPVFNKQASLFRRTGIGRILIVAGKLIITLALLGYPISKIVLENIGTAMSSLNPFAFAVIVCFFLLANIIAAQRWCLFIPDRIDIRRIRSLFVIGAFFNICFPGIVGGDVIKAYYLNRNLKGKHEQESEISFCIDKNTLEPYTVNSISVGSVFMDRFMGQ